MAWFLGQSLIVIVLAFLLGLLVGWLLWGRRRPPATRTEPAEPAEPAATPAVAAPVAPAAAVEETVEPAAPAEADPAATRLTADVTVPTPGPDPDETPAPEVEPAPAAESDPADTDGPEAASEPEPTVVEPDAVALVDAEPDSPAKVEAKVEPEAVGRAGAEGDLAADATPVVGVGGGSGEEAPEPVAEPVAEDDLQRIEGIGPRMEDALRRAGISTYARLADAKLTELRTAINTAGMRFAPSMVSWPEQARLLADGADEAHAELTGRLVAGRMPGKKVS